MELRITDKVNRFPGLASWHFVGVPEEVSSRLFKNAPKGPWKFLPITAKLGKTEWRTALLPLGEGKFFIAIKAKVRKAEDVMQGDHVVITLKI